MNAVMTGIMHLSPLSRDLILCDLVAVTAHGESSGDVSPRESQGSPAGSDAASFR